MYTVLFPLALAADIHVPADQATLQAGVDAASAGDVIIVDAGTFPDAVVVDVADLTIRGAGSDLTVLGPGASEWLVTLEPPGSLTIEDLAIIGAGSRGAVLGEFSGAGTGYITLRRVHVSDSFGVQQGAGDLLIEDSMFRDNLASAAYAASAVGTMGGPGNVTVTGSTFCNNSGSGAWGALQLVTGLGTSSHVEGSIFVGNGGSFGGAVWIDGDARLVNNTFIGNYAASAGAAVRVFDDTTTLVNNLIIGSSGAVAVEASGGTIAASSDHNLYFANSAGDSSALYGPNDVLADPLLANPVTDCDTFDIALLPGSPAIGAGNPLGLSNDIGAYDYLPADLDQDGVPGDVDCDDEDPTVGMPDDEVVGNETDEDCDGRLLCWVDYDGDGQVGQQVEGNAPGLSCDEPGFGYTEDAVDCDDQNSSTYMGAPEIHNDGIDQDCNGSDTYDCFVDEDGDGYGDAPQASPNGLCEDAGLAVFDGDCDDADPLANPAATDTPCNGVDEDCDGQDTGTCDTGSAPTKTDAPTPPTQDDGVEKSGCGCQSSAPSVAWSVWMRRR